MIEPGSTVPATEPASNDDGSVQPRVTVVTGAASGIGRATALRFADSGEQVLCVDIALPRETIGVIRERGGHAEGRSADVSKPEAWEKVVEAAHQLGEIAALANVAGVMSKGEDSVVGQVLDEWNRILSVNLTGAWLGMRAVLPDMLRAGSGAIVNVASGLAFVGVQNTAAYSASKGALVALTRQAAAEYGPSGVRINAVAPGVIDTPLTTATIGDEIASGVSQTLPARRLGTPEDIANAIVHLASDDSSYVVGQTIVVDGGLTAAR